MMTHKSITGKRIYRYLQRLASGDTETWKYMPYQMKMVCRRIDLTGMTTGEIGLSEERSYSHRDSGGPDLHKLLRSLPISQMDAALDIGCGKGGALLTLARHPFSRVDGIEISPYLASVARQNVQRLGISNATIVCTDAAEFRDYDDYTYIYMYNPFPEVVLRSVIGNLSVSVERRRRNLTLIYKNPVFHAIIVSAGFRQIGETLLTHLHHPFRIYVRPSEGIPA
jgi:SAM-dependent methyltransferase